jgi:PilZ domain
VALGLQSRNQRRSHRLDVLLRVKGELVPLTCPITIFNLNKTGFAVLSEARFRRGEQLEFRLKGARTPPVRVTAAAVHTQPVQDSPGLYMTGFAFQPERSGGAEPETAIRQLIAAVAPAGFKV